MKSVLGHWGEIVGRMRSAPGIFIALDFDGVLAPIAVRPELAKMSLENRTLLECLAKQPGVHAAVVSGRSLADVERQVAVTSLVYAGNHGAEIFMRGSPEQHIPLQRYRSALVEAQAELLPWLTLYPGLRIEDKGFGIGVHYRELPAARIPEFQDAFALWAKGLPEDLGIFPAKMLYEVRPNVEWNKGSAVLRIWQALAPASLPFCLGDDRTDEDGFIALKGRGINIFVGTAKESCAEFFLESTEDVTVFLRRLLEATRATFNFTV